MKKIYFIVVGLIGLMTTLSCEDKFTYDDEKNFLPLAYEAKGTEDISTTLLVLGIKGLVFDEIEKSDWKIITQSKATFRGEQPLSVDRNLYPIEDYGSVFMEIPTNYGVIPVTFGNTKVTYTYMGQERELYPIDPLSVGVKIEEIGCVYEPAFIQSGYVVFTLAVGLVPVQVHKMPFIVVDSKINPDDFDDEGNPKENENPTEGENPEDGNQGNG